MAFGCQSESSTSDPESSFIFSVFDTCARAPRGSAGGFSLLHKLDTSRKCHNTHIPSILDLLSAIWHHSHPCIPLLASLFQVELFFGRSRAFSSVFQFFSLLMLPLLLFSSFLGSLASSSSPFLFPPLLSPRFLSFVCRL